MWTSYFRPEPFCRQLPKDIGKSCSKASDCEERCAAKTKTCDMERSDGSLQLGENGAAMNGPVE